MSLVLHTEIKFLSFFFFVLLMKALDFSENTEISVKPHIISSVFMSWVQKRESEVSYKLGRWRKTRTNIYGNFWWGSEVPKIHPNFPQRTNAPVKPEGKKSERDSDRGGKCSVCDKQRGLNWGEKNLIREQEIPSQTKQSTKKVTSGSCGVWETLKIYLTLMGKKYGTAGCFKTSSRSAVTQTHPIFPFQ